MEVGDSEALSYFRRLPTPMQAPSLHPQYVRADASRSSELTPVFLVFETGGEVWYCAAHLSAVEGTNLVDLQSPYGYGGPVASTVSRGFLESAWAAFADWCRRRRVLVEFVRFHPLLENWEVFPGEVRDDRETVWIDLRQGELLASYESRARTAIRKAIKSGLRVEWWPASRFLSSFPPLYRRTMEGLQADSFYLFPEHYFEAMAGFEGLQYAACLLGDELVAGAMFLNGGKLVEYHLSASSADGKKLGATNLLLHEAALKGQRDGRAQLHLGGGTNADPGNPLLFFKSGFSGRRASFRIGKWVHDEEGYTALKAQWQAKHGCVNNRVLFYRS